DALPIYRADVGGARVERRGADDVPPLRLRARRRAQELLLRDQRGRARDVGPRRRPTVVRRPAGGDRGGSAGHDDDRRRAPPVTVILGIETSCDETAAAVVRDGREVLSSVVDRKSTRLNSSHRTISYAVFCLKKKRINK